MDRKKEKRQRQRWVWEEMEKGEKISSLHLLPPPSDRVYYPVILTVKEKKVTFNLSLLA